MSAVTTPRKAFPTTSGLPGGRIYDAAELLVWLAGLNLMIVLTTFLGGVVLGLAPALAAAASVSRSRVRGDAQPLLRTFAAVWRREFWRANAVLAPFAVLALVLGANLYSFGPLGGALVVALWVALGVVGLAATFAVMLFTHYELPLRRYATTAVRYLLHDLPATALVVVVTVLAVLLTGFLPGLLPVLTVGAWVHAVSAICFSCFARNDQLVAASSSSTSPE
ncbi:DUF624 domain-containing protein [Pseudactinotalea suaedae]|uniref:DUF624 domain-containing protein n=1 Tax=Pseudactinotalea suaedae TaxID=1524924 RepID=UPI0012E2EA1E|nr:DUF624 domain-containing protein [Pseudactinotalea suaedae]